MLQGKGEGAFAGGAQAGHPDRAAALLEQIFTNFTVDVPFMPGDVVRFYFHVPVRFAGFQVQYSKFQVPD
jgi:hypothetical protein